MKNHGLRRRRPFRQPLRRFLIVCEGEVTEPDYFKKIGLLERGLVSVETVSRGVPERIVAEAIRRKGDAEAESKRKADENLAYDEVWCVFDVDEHPFVPEARHQASANGIQAAVSNPCFELWALLHFQDQTAHIHRREVLRLCRRHMPGYDKQLPFEDLIRYYEDARRRARELEHRHADDGAVGDNPSTGVYRLVESIRAQRQRWHPHTRG